MAFSSVASASVQGLHVEIVHAEADVSNGLPMFHMVGYLSSEVKEASERVRTAIKNSGIQIPPKKTVINLAPATVKKRGPSYDLPIALSVLVSMGNIPGEKLVGTLVIGELSLDGRVRKVTGVLPIVLEARKRGYHTCILPKENAQEGKLVSDMVIIGVTHLREVCEYLCGERKIACEEAKGRTEGEPSVSGVRTVDYSDIKGQEMVKRATEVAVAGSHNLLLIGPPGSGKSMIAARIPTILPPLSEEESMEITKIYSVMGMVDKKRPLITGRPFRSVHHTVTKAALIGGGVVPAPGEISLAHGGVLFLDELAEFSKPVLEVLRQPLEEHQIRLNRKYGNYTFPADFMLVAALNPCPCGMYPLPACQCTQSQIRQYLGHVSQPFLDRIDICIEAPKISYDELNAKKDAESSETIRKRVCKAREIQNERFHGTDIRSNASLTAGEVEKYCVLGEGEERLMKRAFTTLGLTARTYHKVLKTARTIADLDGEEQILTEHLKEAIGYRMMNKKYWGR